MREKIHKKNFFCQGDFTPFMSKSLQIWDHFFPLLFSMDSENLKHLDIGLQEVGAKRPLNVVRNNNIKTILLSKANFSQKLTFLCSHFTPFIRELKAEITIWWQNYRLVIFIWGLVFLGLVIGDFPNPEGKHSKFKIANWLLYHQLVISTFSSL